MKKFGSLLLVIVFTFTYSPVADGKDARESSSGNTMVSSCLQYMTNLHSSITDEDGKPNHVDLLASVLCLSDYGES